MYLLDDKKMIHWISWHQIESDKALANDLLQIKQAGLIPEDKVRIGVIGDGAPWIWNRIREIYPDAKKVLDFFSLQRVPARLGQCAIREKQSESTGVGQGNAYSPVQ